jgi:hypothetical protein
LGTWFTFQVIHGVVTLKEVDERAYTADTEDKDIEEYDKGVIEGGQQEEECNGEEGDQDSGHDGKAGEENDEHLAQGQCATHEAVEYIECRDADIEC